MYEFDLFGWYTGPGTGKRSTPIAPLNLSTADTPGALRANFTGHVWVDLPYVVPVLDNPLPELRKTLRQAVRVDKHSRAIAGVLILPANRWIASDATARARWAAMAALGAALPADQEDETLDETSFTVTPAFAAKVITAYATLDRALQANAKTLITTINGSPDPASIDLTVGWPVTYPPQP